MRRRAYRTLAFGFERRSTRVAPVDPCIICEIEYLISSVSRVPQGFLAQLDTIRLDSNAIDNTDAGLLCRALTHAFERLRYLSLEGNRIDDGGMDALRSTLKDPYGPPLLERLAVSNNPASSYAIEAVYRQLKERDKSAGGTYKQNFR